AGHRDGRKVQPVSRRVRARDARTPRPADRGADKLMDPKLQRRVQRYGWDKAAASYERYWQAQLAPAQERLLALAALRPGERVLDIACGTGLVTLPAAERVGPSGSVMATDISEAMITRIRDEAARRGLPHLTAARMDAERLDVPD